MHMLYTVLFVKRFVFTWLFQPYEIIAVLDLALMGNYIALRMQTDLIRRCTCIAAPLVFLVTLTMLVGRISCASSPSV